MALAKKLFYLEELNGCWSTARDKGIEYAQARGHSPNSLHNDRKDMLYVGCEMQDIGGFDPADIDQSVFNLWRQYTMSDENRAARAITEKGFKKRKEALILLLKANHLSKQLEIVQMHRSNIRHEKLDYWNEDELEAMTTRALHVYEQEPDKRAAAIAHFINRICPPRREDTAQMMWQYIDFEENCIQFPAKKNGRQAGNFIEPRFIPHLQGWKEETSRYAGGDEYVFPSSMAQSSGTTKTPRPHVTGKTIAKHLDYIRDTTILGDGSIPRRLSGHKYRHSFAMLALKNRRKMTFIAKVLGDSVSTVEEYYSRFLLNGDHKMEHELMTKKLNQRISSEGTVQPPKLKRHSSSLPSANQMAIAEGFRLYDEGGGRCGI
jgi:integrase